MQDSGVVRVQEFKITCFQRGRVWIEVLFRMVLSFEAEGSGLRLVLLQLIACLGLSEVSKSNRSGVSKPKPCTLKPKPEIEKQTKINETF